MFIKRKTYQDLMDALDLQRDAIRKHIERTNELLDVGVGLRADLDSVRSESYRQSKEIHSLTKQLRKPIEVEL
jgi:hypothetical protein